MKQPLQIRFLGIEPSAAVEAAARRKVDKLDTFCPDLMSCRVSIEQAHKHRHHGRPFAVRVDVTLPGHELSVDRVHDDDVYIALRDAFDDMKRKLEDVVRRMRGQEKLHPALLHGEVVRLGDDRQCGFIRTPEGDEYYFAADNVSGIPFEHLQVGTVVRFIPEVAAQGRQAKRVSVGKHGTG